MQKCFSRRFGAVFSACLGASISQARRFGELRRRHTTSTTRSIRTASSVESIWFWPPTSKAPKQSTTWDPLNPHPSSQYTLTDLSSSPVHGPHEVPRPVTRLIMAPKSPRNLRSPMCVTMQTCTNDLAFESLSVNPSFTSPYMRYKPFSNPSSAGLIVTSKRRPRRRH